MHLKKWSIQPNVSLTNVQYYESMRMVKREHDELDRVFDVLQDQHRRYVLHALSESQQPMHLTDLANAVVDQKGQSNHDGTTETVERVRTSLHHAHLPKLADFGVIEYDVDERRVKLIGNDTLDRFTDEASLTTNQ